MRQITGTYLDTILESTERDLVLRRERVPVAKLERRSQARGAGLSLKNALAGKGLSVVAEVKRGSPSKGRFPSTFAVGDLVTEYAKGGASAISILTDEPFFHGSIVDLQEGRIAVDQVRPLPLLRKDFIIDEYQILEARAFGADALLLIVAALGISALRRLLLETREHGLEALVEVHDEQELDMAIDAGADIVGINNRDLRTFETDLSITERLGSLAPDHVTLVGESGIHSAIDAARMAAAGADAVLVGESLILASDRAAAIQELIRVETPT